MAQLVVRKLEEGIVRNLRERAAKAQVSMEEEHRRILRSALAGGIGKSFKEHLLAIPEGEASIFRRRRTTTARKLEL